MALSFKPRIVCRKPRRLLMNAVTEDNGIPVEGQTVVAILDGEVTFEPCGDTWTFRSAEDEESFAAELRLLVEAHEKYPSNFDDQARAELTEQAQRLLDEYARDGRVLPSHRVSAEPSFGFDM